MNKLNRFTRPNVLEHSATFCALPTVLLSVHLAITVVARNTWAYGNHHHLALYLTAGMSSPSVLNKATKYRRWATSLILPVHQQPNAHEFTSRAIMQRQHWKRNVKACTS